MTSYTGETWHDQKPSHPTRQRAVIDTADAAIEAWQRFDAEIDRVYDGRNMEVCPEDFAMLDALRRAAQFCQALADETAEAYHAGNLKSQIYEHDIIEFGRHAMTEENLP